MFVGSGVLVCVLVGSIVSVGDLVGVTDLVTVFVGGGVD